MKLITSTTKPLRPMLRLQVRLISADFGLADVRADGDDPVTGEVDYREAVTGEMAYSQQASVQTRSATLNPEFFWLVNPHSDPDRVELRQAVSAQPGRVAPRSFTSTPDGQPKVRDVNRDAFGERSEPGIKGKTGVGMHGTRLIASCASPGCDTTSNLLTNLPKLRLQALTYSLALLRHWRGTDTDLLAMIDVDEYIVIEHEGAQMQASTVAPSPCLQTLE